MSITCNDLIKYAESISESGADEVVYRASISRAYYAAYHYALDFCMKNGIRKDNTSTKEGSHSQLINALNDANGCDEEIRKKANNLAQKLRLVRAERICADYMTKQEISQQRALSQISAVRRILKIS